MLCRGSAACLKRQRLRFSGPIRGLFGTLCTRSGMQWQRLASAPQPRAIERFWSTQGGTTIRLLFSIIAIVLATGFYAQDGEDQTRINLPHLIPEELRIPNEGPKSPWVCKCERAAAEIMVSAIFAQAHEHKNTVLARDYFAAITAVKDYRQCIGNVRNPQWAPLPGNMG
jgi:hypothetical protein